MFWGRHLRASGYPAASSRNVTDEVIMKYIKQQRHEPPYGEFKIAVRMKIMHLTTSGGLVLFTKK